MLLQLQDERNEEFLLDLGKSPGYLFPDLVRLTPVLAARRLILAQEHVHGVRC